MTRRFHRVAASTLVAGAFAVGLAVAGPAGAAPHQGGTSPFDVFPG